MTNGLVSAITQGSSILIMPTMMLAGLPLQNVIGTQNLYNVISLLPAFPTHLKRIYYNFLGFKHFFILAVLGAILGTLLTQLAVSHYVQLALPLVFFLISINLLFYKSIQIRIIKKVTHLNNKFRWLPVLGGLLGIYSGFIGPGAGPLCTLTLGYLLHFDIKKASMIAYLFIFITNILSFFIFLMLHRVNFPIGLVAALFALLGCFMGRCFSPLLSESTAHKIILLSALGVSIYLIFRNFHFL